MRCIIGHFVCHGKPSKTKIQQTVVGGDGDGEIVAPAKSGILTLINVATPIFFLSPRAREAGVGSFIKDGILQHMHAALTPEKEQH